MTELWLPILFAFGFQIFILFVIFHFFEKRNKQIKDLYERISSKRNGELVIKNVFSWKYFSGVRIPCDSEQVTLCHIPGQKNSPPYTMLKCDLNVQNDCSLNVYPETVLSKIGKGLGGQDILMGYPPFDEVFIIKSKNEMLARSVLVPEIQESILSLKNKHPHLKLNKKKFELSVPQDIMVEEEIDQFIDVAQKIVRKIKETG
ncbi:MAG: DUF3137 domain-containing protein [Candidatus Omnitrophica bacterium]|nr:DUF3137 domain-containing protein [Candidatus Omnitrophota bacterium]